MAANAARRVATNLKSKFTPEQPWADASVLSKFTIDDVKNSTSVIEPKFWYGNYSNAIPASQYTIDCSEPQYLNNVTINNKELKNKIEEIYNNTGLVYIKNTGLTDLSKMHELTTPIIPRNDIYEGGSNWRNHIEPNVYDTGAPKEAWLHYHHEMTYISESPLCLAFCCAESVKNKGATFVSDGIKSTEYILSTELGEKLKEKGICFIRCLTDREYYKNQQQSEFDVYNHWQQSFNTNDMDKASELAISKGYQIEWENHPRWGRYLKTKFYTSAFEYDKYSDKNLLYASIADHHSWFDTWPGVKDLLPVDRPLKITYGDDTEFTHDELKLFVDVYDKYGIPIYWNKGDVAIVCNLRWAHGRPMYSLNENEKRELGVVLGPLFRRQGVLPDKW